MCCKNIIICVIFYYSHMWEVVIMESFNSFQTYIIRNLKVVLSQRKNFTDLVNYFRSYDFLNIL